MTTEFDQARQIAERIARKVAGGYGATPARSQPELGSELAAVRAGISELQKKLAQLEAKVSTDSSDTRFARTGTASFTPPSPPSTPVTHSPWLAGINAPYAHPSQEKFGVEEATVTELVDFLEKEKICNVEPGGKPCDHCAMCSSRGF